MPERPHATLATRAGLRTITTAVRLLGPLRDPVASAIGAMWYLKQSARVRERAEKSGKQFADPFVFEGNAPSDVRENVLLNALLRAGRADLSASALSSGATAPKRSEGGPVGQDARQRVPTNRPSALVDTRVIYCGDNLEQLQKLPDACVDLSYIDPPFNSNRNYEVF